MVMVMIRIARSVVFHFTLGDHAESIYVVNMLTQAFLAVFLAKVNASKVFLRCNDLESLVDFILRTVNCLLHHQ